MKSDIIELYEAIFKPQGIHTLFLQSPFHEIKKADYGFREHIFENYNYHNLSNMLEKANKELPILIFKDEFMAEYCLLLLPKKWQKKYDSTYFLIGPVLFDTVTNIEISKILERHHLPSNLYNDFLEFYNRIPHIPSRDFWISLLEPLLDEIYDGNTHREYYECNQSFMESYEIKDSGFSLETIEARYEAEHQLLAAVQTGNFDEAIKCHSKFAQFKIPLRATDSLRSRKNLTLTLNTLFRKSIEVSHVHPYYIDRVSSDFSIKIEKAVNESQLESIALQMLRKYCSLVKSFSTKDLSALVEKCVHQIHFHYSDPLSLEILAEANAVSTSYLSTLFHKETGKTITNYINETRINRSLLLLNTTTLSVSEIASQCGFSDANYYTRTFKKSKGITPMAYRKSINKA